MILQLNPPIPVVTPKGKAIAHFIFDTGIENDMQWVCFQDSTGECWAWSNPKIRAQINITHGRDYISPFYPPETAAFSNEDEKEEEEDEELADQLEEIAYLKDICEDQSETIKDFQEEVNKLNDKLKSLKSLIGKLIRDDHIFGDSRETAKEVMNSVNEDDENELPY